MTATVLKQRDAARLQSCRKRLRRRCAKQDFIADLSSFNYRLEATFSPRVLRDQGHVFVRSAVLLAQHVRQHLVCRWCRIVVRINKIRHCIVLVAAGFSNTLRNIHGHLYAPNKKYSRFI